METSDERSRTGLDDETVFERRPPAAGAPPGALLAGRYRVLRELGRGGMGVVYLVHDGVLERELALKLLTSAYDEDQAQRLAREARLTAQLDHRAVIPVHDLGRLEDGRLYYTMRRITGVTLSDLLHGAHVTSWGELPRDPAVWSVFRLLQAFATACQAVAYAHDHGVVHRDIKPSNIMVGRFGQVYLLDWGLAKQVGASDEAPALPARHAASGEGPGSDVTRTGELLGTPVFMAPEQARLGGEVGFATDVYALGGLLYMLLTGEAPRTGSTARILVELARGVAVPSPRERRPDVPSELERVCRAALALAPEDRPSAATLAEVVEAYLEGRTLDPPRPGEAEYLRTYRPADFRRPSLTVDVVLLRLASERPPALLLQRRARPPFAGMWALPGTFVRLEEPLEEAVARLLREECGELPAGRPTQLGAWGSPGRDPRTRVITVAYRVEVAAEAASAHEPELVLEPEADAVRWFELPAPGTSAAEAAAADPAAALGVELAFDHAEIVRAALRA